MIKESTKRTESSMNMNLITTSEYMKKKTRRTDKFTTKIGDLGDFPGGQVAKTPSSHCGGPGFNLSHIPQLRPSTAKYF